MISLLSKWFIKDRDNVTDPTVRRAYGSLCGIVGIALNLLLFAGKFLAGILSGSIAVTADAFNNLSDAGSSVITLLGFRLAGKKPDPDHPAAHRLQAHLRPSADRFQGHAAGSQKHRQAAHPVAVACAFPVSLFEFLALSFAQFQSCRVFHVFSNLYYDNDDTNCLVLIGLYF